MLIATDLKTGDRVTRIPAHYGPLNSLAVTISGGRELVLTGGDDGLARVFDLSLDTKEPVAEFDDGRDCPVTAVEWSADGNQCFVGGVDNEVKVGRRYVWRVKLMPGVGPADEQGVVLAHGSHGYGESQPPPT